MYGGSTPRFLLIQVLVLVVLLPSSTLCGTGSLSVPDDKDFKKSGSLGRFSLMFTKITKATVGNLVPEILQRLVDYQTLCQLDDLKTNTFCLFVNCCSNSTATNSTTMTPEAIETCKTKAGYNAGFLNAPSYVALLFGMMLSIALIL